MSTRVTSHHGEIIQGDFREGYALVTLPCPLFWSRASYTPSNDLIVPKGKTKVRELLSKLKITGRVTIESNIPSGWGLGSSTADLLAVLRSVSKLPAQEEAQMLAAIEGTDPIMFPDVVLFSPKTGDILENFGRLPPMKVIGFNTDPRGTSTSNTRRPTRNIELFERLRYELRDAMEIGDIAKIGRLATESSEFNQITRPKTKWEYVKKIADMHSALGIQVAHSGTVVGLIFPPDFNHETISNEITGVFGECWNFNT